MAKSATSSLRAVWRRSVARSGAWGCPSGWAATATQNGDTERASSTRSRAYRRSPSGRPEILAMVLRAYFSPGEPEPAGPGWALSSLGPSLGGPHGVAQQHGPGHRSHPAEPWGEPPGDLGDGLVHIRQEALARPGGP